MKDIRITGTFSLSSAAKKAWVELCWIVKADWVIYRSVITGLVVLFVLFISM